MTSAAPRLRARAVVLLGLQAVVLLGTAVWVALPGTSSALLTAAMTLVGAGVFALLTRGTAQAALWARTPAVLLEVLFGITGIVFIRGGVAGAGVPVVVVAVATIVAVVQALPGQRSGAR